MTLEIEDVKDLIQMVDLLIKRNSIENGNLKELRILLKDERILKIKNKPPGSRTKWLIVWV